LLPGLRVIPKSASWARDLRLTALCVEGEGITAARAATR